MERVGISLLYTKDMNIEILRPLGDLVGKCIICLVLEKDVSHIIETEMLVFQISGCRSETL